MSRRSVIIEESVSYLWSVRTSQRVQGSTAQRVSDVDFSPPSWCKTSSFKVEQDSVQAYESLHKLQNVDVRELVRIVEKNVSDIKTEPNETIREDVKQKMVSEAQKAIGKYIDVAHRSYQDITNLVVRGVCHVVISQDTVSRIVITDTVDAMIGPLVDAYPELASALSPTTRKPGGYVNENVNENASGTSTIVVAILVVTTVIVVSVVLMILLFVIRKKKSH